jgi:hypothetical protein
MRRASKVILLVLLAPFAAFVVCNLPGFLMARVPKTGRIVDATSGEGIRDVTVIASAVFSSCGGLVETRCESFTEYRLLTRTDANGRYWIRPAFGGLGTLVPLLGEKDEEWHITAVRPGYAIVGDHVAWTYLDESGRPKFPPPSASDVPPAYSLVLFALVDPIRMYRVDLDLKQTAIYMSGVVPGDSFVRESKPSEEVALRRRIFAPLQASVCAQRSDADLDLSTYGAFLDLAPDRAAFLTKAREIDPDIAKDFSLKRRYSAAVVCEEMKAGNARATP